MICWVIKTRQSSTPGKKIVIAVVDDGFRFSHRDLAPFIYNNPGEIRDNNIDDDNNGYIDDYNGWDVSDNDNDVSPPKGREEEFYHGTAISGIICDMLKKAYGDDNRKFCILPVKVISSQSQNTAILDGYKGIRYAISLNPDIICCAWSGGNPSDEEKAIIEEALMKGIIVIASAGNFYAEKVEFPSGLPDVWSIAATDSLNRKLDNSSFGMRVDFALPGINIKAPYPAADNSYFMPQGTSVATAVMAGCAAIVKVSFPDAGRAMVEEALKNTCQPIDSLNIRYCGKLGAGIPDISKALLYLGDTGYRFSAHNPSLSRGTLVFNPQQGEQTLDIKPAGAYQGFFLQLIGNSGKQKGTVKILSGNRILLESRVSELARIIYVNGSSLRVELDAPPKTVKNLKFSYYPKTIDSTRLYCSDISYFNTLNGEICDGSGNSDYANNCSCKWLITVPQGKRIRLEFPEFDTQAKIDFVWLFDGDETLPGNVIAKFSGPEIPPHVTSATNKVLVWFVTDGSVTRKGWCMKYSAVDN